MKIKHLLQVASTIAVAVFIMVASANATTITFNTNAAGTVFFGDGLSKNSSSGAAATLVFTPDANIAVGVPSNINYGNFTLTCAACTTQAGGAGAVFNAFTFDLILTDVTDGATGEFVGTSTGGTIYSDLSPINISWAPLQLGPDGINALSGNFNGTDFTISNMTAIVAPNSGAVPGETTVQGFVNVPVPEPSTVSLIGSALVGLGMLRRKRFFRQ